MGRAWHLFSQLNAMKTLHSPMELDAPLDSSDNLSVDGRDTPRARLQIKTFIYFTYFRIASIHKTSSCPIIAVILKGFTIG